MKNSKKQFILSALAVSALHVCPMAAAEGATSAASSQEQLMEYSLDDIIVTATRTKKREVDVAASTETITRKEIRDSGAQNAAEIIQKVNGVSYASFAPLGASMGTMINKATIRGIDNGTLVLVNGNPVSARGLYRLQEMPADTIERVEIVKGGGSVLYGSEAMAGVINIITKKTVDNNWALGFGNYGQQKYHLNVGAEEGDQSVTAFYDVNKWDEYNDISESDFEDRRGNLLGKYQFNVRDIRNESLGVTWRANDHLNVTYGHYEADASYDKVIRELTARGRAVPGRPQTGDIFYNRDYLHVRDTAQVNYQDQNWKGSLYYNVSTIEAQGFNRLDNYLRRSNRAYHTKEKHISYGFDAQRKWQLDEKANLIFGVSGKHEIFHVLPTTVTTGANARNFMRNQWGVFGQWEQKLDEKNSFTLGARETWTTGAMNNMNYSNFSASGQFLHKMEKDNHLYLNISQSFIMPQFAQMFPSGGSSRSNPNLKPQSGINYELGWKNLHGGHTWKAAVFHQTIKDNISAVWNASSSEWRYTNLDFRNTGFEFSCDIAGKNGFSYNYGLTLQDPKVKGGTKNFWDRKFGRIQLIGGVNYTREKWRGALSFTYLADRVQAPSNTPSFPTKPYLLTTLTLGYAPDAWSEIDLKVDNLLNRRDNTMHSSSAYYTPGTSYLLSYTKWF